MNILCIAEHDNQHLKPVTRVVIQAALDIRSHAGDETSTDITLLVAGSDCQAVATQAASIPGVSRVLLADDACFTHQLAEPLADLVTRLGADCAYVLAAHTTTGKNFIPRVAAKLDVAQISDITGVVSEDTFTRPIYAGNVIATVRSNDPIKVISIRGTGFDAVAGEANPAPIEPCDAKGGVVASEFVGEELGQSERPELTSAGVVISGGRGMQNGENFKLLEGIADKLGAAIGASRAAVDAGFVPNDMQVGQTGKIVAPELYIAVGISGAIQHLAGMKDSKIIVAVNKDEEAPIFQVADYGLVADLFKALPEFESSL